MSVKILTFNLDREIFVDFTYNETNFTFVRVTELKQVKQYHKSINDICIVIMDYDAFIQLNKSTRAVMKLWNTKIVIMDKFIDTKDIIRVFRLGAYGCLLDAVSKSDFHNVIYTIFKGDSALDSAVASKLANSYRVEDNTPLTPREQEILIELSKGRSYRSICDELSISVDTVRTHVKHIYDKLQVNKRDDALDKARLLKYI